MTHAKHIHFVTGRLAEFSLRTRLETLGPEVGFDYTIDVLPITVAALMRPKWVARRMRVSPKATEVMLPGYCDGDLSPVEQAAGIPVERGPKDLRQLPEFFGGEDMPRPLRGRYDIEIIAEINSCPRLPLNDIVAKARQYADHGADVVDVGCEPGDTWSGVADCVKALKDNGHRVSIDSMNPVEIGAAVAAGAELALSVNKSNRDAVVDLDAQFVIIPDEPHTLEGLDETIDRLENAGRSYRVDPILDPIGCGFAHSLARYFRARERFPDAEMMMGIGNLTELTDVDSAGVNVLLLGFCQELEIRSVLTTQVINWARTSVKECDAARRLAFEAVREGIPPKRLSSELVALRDDHLYENGERALANLAETIKDNNYRIFAERDELHLISAGLYDSHSNPYQLFADLLARQPENLDPSHAFYLGYEMAKAKTALTLGKAYRQDQPLDWGYLTEPEHFVRLPRKRRRPPSTNETKGES
jgi:dihydropteroate synthase-like protein